MRAVPVDDKMAVTIKKVGVIGSGQMGNGIAHVAALAGFDVVLNDVSDDRLEIGDGDHQRQSVAPGRQEGHHRGRAQAGARPDHVQPRPSTDCRTAIS